MTAWVVLLTLPATAFAADGEQVGENLGNMLSSWGKSIYFGVAGIIAVMLLFNRKFADLAVFLIAVVVVGGIVFAQNDVISMVRGFWNSLTA